EKHISSVFRRSGESIQTFAGLIRPRLWSSLDLFAQVMGFRLDGGTVARDETLEFGKIGWSIMFPHGEQTRVGPHCSVAPIQRSFQAMATRQIHECMIAFR